MPRIIKQRQKYIGLISRKRWLAFVVNDWNYDTATTTSGLDRRMF